jgi:hypothetical protein
MFCEAVMNIADFRLPIADWLGMSDELQFVVAGILDSRRSEYPIIDKLKFVGHLKQSAIGNW